MATKVGRKKGDYDLSPGSRQFKRKPSHWDSSRRINHRIISEEEYLQFSNTGFTNVDTYVSLMWHTGGRSIEVAYLRYADVFLFNGWPHVTLRSAKKKKRCPVCKEYSIKMDWEGLMNKCKTCNKVSAPITRTIPIPKYVYNRVQNLKKVMGKTKFDYICNTKSPGGLKIWRYFLGAKTKSKEFTWHSFRHTFASRMSSIVPDIALVCEWCGWDDFDAFYRVYRHSDPTTNLLTYLKATDQQIPINMDKQSYTHKQTFLTSD